MKLLEKIESVVKGAAYGTAAIILLPVCGGVFAASAGALAIGSTLGAAAGLIDKLTDDE